MALPETAAASGTVASISSWPGGQRLLQVRQRLGLVAERHAQDHAVARAGRGDGAGVVVSGEAPTGDERPRALRGFLGASRVARADRDRHAGAREAQREAEPEGA